MIATLIEWALGKGAPYLIGAGILAAIILGAWSWLASHDAALKQGWEAQQAAAVAQAQLDARVAGDAAVAAAVADAAKAQADLANIRKEIANAPATTVCADSSLAHDVLDSLFPAGAGHR